MKRSSERGAVLIISLVLLVVLTLFVLSSTRIAGGSLRIVNNIQSRQAVDNASQAAMEPLLMDSVRSAHRHVCRSSGSRR